MKNPTSNGSSHDRRRTLQAWLCGPSTHVTFTITCENYRTSLGGIDLYPDVLDKLRSIENVGGHPFEFYLKAGYHVVGVIPDANGFGKPDILMAKRILES